MKYIVTVRGTLKDPANAQQAHDAIVSAVSPQSKTMGSTGHQAFLNPQNPREFFAVDAWNNMEGIQKMYSDPKLGEAFAQLFEGQPEVGVWADSGWFQY